METYVIGDIHGKYKALKEVLTLCQFNYDKDRLIILGDVVDGSIHVEEVVDELLKIKNRVFILGNHDKWFMDWYLKDETPHVWTSQGGSLTIRSYADGVKQKHKEFFQSAVLFYEENNMLFVHGGLGKNTSPRMCDEETLLWDREMVERAVKRNQSCGAYKWIFAGHSTTQMYGTDVPIIAQNVIMMDTGAGWNGKLSILRLSDFKVWQSKTQKPEIDESEIRAMLETRD